MQLCEEPLPDLRDGVDEQLRHRVELLQRVLVPDAGLLADLQNRVAGRQPEPGALRGTGIIIVE